MAEELERPVNRTIRIRIKGSFRGAGAADALASTAGRNTCGAAGSTALGDLAPGELKALAQKRRNVLIGYVAPGASPSRIVAVLKDEGPTLVPDILQPRWDSSLDVPGSSSVQPLKRYKAEVGDSGNLLAGCSTSAEVPGTLSWRETAGAAAGLEQWARKESYQVASKVQPQRAEPEEDTKLKALSDDQGHGVHPPGSSGSDHATTTAFHLPCSPAGDPGQEHAQHRASAPTWQQQPASGPVHDRAHAGETHEASHVHAAVEVPGTSAQAGTGRVLPHTFLGPVGPAAQPFCGFTPFALRMPSATARLPQHITDSVVSSTVEAAAACKRSGDKLRGSPNAPWRVGSLSKYVEASLKYMEACEYMQRLPRSSERATKIMSLYGQTAELLTYTSKQAECNMRGNAVGKQALRVVCDRLAAVCHMREAAHTSSRHYSDIASRMTLLLQRHAASFTQHGGAGGHSLRAAGGSDARQQQQQPSPEASSSHGPAASSSAAASGYAAQQRLPVPQFQQQQQQQQQQAGIVAEMGQMQPKLLAAAQKVSKYMDLLRRSTVGFQELIDWPEVQSNELAKLACMHIAATFANAGMGDGLQLIAHAREAIVHIRVL